jgi:hypothetical protein
MMTQLEQRVFLVDGPAEGLELTETELGIELASAEPQAIRVRATSPFSYMTNGGDGIYTYVFSHRNGELFFYIHLPE